MKRQKNTRLFTKKPTISGNVSRSNLKHSIPDTSEAELISQMLINKMIAVVVIDTHMKKVDERIEDFVFEGLKTNLTNFTEFNLIHHETDNNRGPQTEPDILYNDWEDVEEPVKPSTDRAMCSAINMIKFEPNEETDNFCKIAETSDLMGVNNSRITHKVPKKNQSTINVGSSYSQLNPNESVDLLKRKSLGTVTPLSKSQIKIPEKEEPPKPKPNPYRGPLTNFPCYDIDPKEFRVEDDSNFERQFQEYQIINKHRRNQERELKKFLEEENQTEREKKEKAKLLNSTMYTFDTNGKILKLKKIQVDKLKGLFFTINSGLKKEKVYKKKKKVKGEEEDKEDDDDKKKKLTGMIKSQSVITKRKDSLDSGEPLKKPEGIICAGDNYELFQPETGVIIKADLGQIKKGDMNFMKKFNKFSFETFTNMAEQTQEINKTFLPSLRRYSGIPEENQSVDELDRSKSLEKSNILDKSNPLEEGIIKGGSAFGSPRKNKSKLLHSMSQNSLKLTEFGQLNLKSSFLESSSPFEMSKNLYMSSGLNSIAKRENILKDQNKFVLNKADSKRLFKSESFTSMPELNNINQFNKSLVLKKNIEGVEDTFFRNEGLKKPNMQISFKETKRNGLMMKPYKSFRVNYKDKTKYIIN